MFEITADDIACLNDEDLRSLVGLLCEAELRSRGLPISAVTWGGNQNAADGGIDVRVTLPAGVAIEGFVPRRCVGFQVKKPDMTPAVIEPEMRPGGVLRPAIRGLAENAGAYILVSSGTNASDSALRERRAAMARALGRLRNRNALQLDFYDRARLASWVRSHPGTILWTRNRIGRGLLGWRPYDAWAFSPEGVDDVYLTEARASLHVGTVDETGLPIAEGIERLRNCLRGPRGIVRLVGLSGVGKTRLVQTLFDARVGQVSLDPTLAIYTDMADGPDPQPTSMASDLIATRARAILVIDNCPPDLHQRLSESCRAPGSMLSVITLEYDIQDDQAEGTDVFQLKPASPELVRQLIRRRYQDISPIDARTIAEFSGGNARIGFALANTLEKSETLAGLSNQELFRRLFHQRQTPDECLLRAAQACALVYSFEGEAISGEEAELPKLGAIIGMSSQELFGKVAELNRRDLLQRRSVWRAVLPQAIADRLAVLALQNFSSEVIQVALDTERLMRSFSRRLGYLRDSKEAVRLVESWLRPDGKLGNLAALNDLGQAMFANIAAVSPHATLEALERAGRDPADLSFAEDVFGFTKTAHLLRSLAYEPELFDRSVALLVKLAELEAREGNRQDAALILGSLFQIRASGTRASIEQRIRVIKPLLLTDNAVHRDLGVIGVGALLKARRFDANHSFAFGAWSRDYGYSPATHAEIEHWYASVIMMIEPLAASDQPVAEQLRHALASRFRELWRVAGIYDHLERVSRSISARFFWPEGWIAMRKTLQHDASHLSEDSRGRLGVLERSLRPAEIVDRVRTVVLTEAWGPLDFADTEADRDGGEIMAAHERAQATAEELGGEVARGSATAFAQLLPDLARGRGARLRAFGSGLARGASDRRAVWRGLVAALAIAVEGGRNVNMLGGYLAGLAQSDPPLCNDLLEEAVSDETLSRWFLDLQASVPLDARAVLRLKRSLAEGKVPVPEFGGLAGGRLPDSLSAKELADLLRAVIAKPGGFEPALKILAMRIHTDKDTRRATFPELVEAGRELVIGAPYQNGNESEDHHLRMVLEACFAGEGGASAAATVAKNFKIAVATDPTLAHHYDQFVTGLFKVQPRAVLDAFFTGEAEDRDLGVRAIEGICHIHENPLDQAADDVVIGWCKEGAVVRYPLVARVILFTRRNAESDPLQWSALALRMLEHAPDPAEVLDCFIKRFEQDRDGGRTSAILETRMQLLDEDKLGAFPALAEFARQKRAEVRQNIEEYRKWETKLDRNHGERFE